MHVVRSQKMWQIGNGEKNKVTLSVAKSLDAFEFVQTIFHMIPCVKLRCRPGVYQNPGSEIILKLSNA